MVHEAGDDPGRLGGLWLGRWRFGSGCFGPHRSQCRVSSIFPVRTSLAGLRVVPPR